jgi:hypothetical protein
MVNKRAAQTRRQMNTSAFLAILGTLLGLYYGYLGIAAGAFFIDEAKRRSIAERVFLNPGWSMGPSDEYTPEGQKLCRRGNWVFVAAILCWFAWGLLR